MRLLTCIAASFTLLAITSAPLTAHAQSQPRPLTPEEAVFIQAFNAATNDATNNRLIQNAADWAKADHAQEICRAFESGSSIEDVSHTLVGISLRLEDESRKKEFREYTSRILVVGTRYLCPEYNQMLDQYLQSL
jgi:DNA replication initiation complex subunit (GINS family)